MHASKDSMWRKIWKNFWELNKALLVCDFVFKKKRVISDILSFADVWSDIQHNF